MAKFCGKVGFITTEKTAPDVWEPQEVERTYYGDELKNFRRWNSNSESTNDNLVINKTISIVADDYAFQNFSFIRYVVWKGIKWKVTEVEEKRPRIEITLGGVWNG